MVYGNISLKIVPPTLQQAAFSLSASAKYATSAAAPNRKTLFDPGLPLDASEAQGW